MYYLSFMTTDHKCNQCFEVLLPGLIRPRDICSFLITYEWIAWMYASPASRKLTPIATSVNGKKSHFRKNVCLSGEKMNVPKIAARVVFVMKGISSTISFGSFFITSSKVSANCSEWSCNRGASFSKMEKWKAGVRSLRWVAHCCPRKIWGGNVIYVTKT